MAAANVVQRIGADRLLAVEQRIRINAVVTLVFGILVKGQRSRVIRSSKLADQRSTPRCGVALYRLVQIKTALTVRFDREHASAEPRR